MSPLVSHWDAPPPDLPARCPSPFDIAPHPVARRAAAALIAELRSPAWAHLDRPGQGKMFGVLVVARGDGRIGALRAFSGMLDGAWQVPGWAPPTFDLAARDAFWPAGEARLAAIDADRAALDTRAAPLRAALAAIDARHADAVAAQRADHLAHRAARRATRAITTDPAALHALDQASRGDTADQRRLRAEHASERAAVAEALAPIEAELVARTAERSARSRGYLQQIHDTYALSDARGVRRSLRELFAPEAPPGGAGDCAAPKLLAAAYAEGLRPIALAEVWWGAPPATGGRHAGAFYPACRGKCGPILAHMLGGLDAAPAPVFGDCPAPGPLRVVHADRWLLVVDKPCGLLSVPGRSGALRDSVLTRLRADEPGASVVHRLDLDTSGLLLVARDPATHAALQQQFARRTVDKRYLAWLTGAPPADAGAVELPLRVDLDDRPRQIVDPVHGAAARTEWQVLARAAGRTRVALIPRTGRTHQLRVHAAHPAGLGAPIVGDRLYGSTPDRGQDPGARLLLHAEALAFVHPHTGARVELVSPAPF